MTCLKKEIALPSRAGIGGLDFNAYDVMAPRKPGTTPATAKNGARVKHNNVPPEGVYLPNNNRLAPHMRSPEYVQMSTAAAITLGVMPGKMHRCACTRCLNLLLTYPEGCRANCAYCGLARHREADRDYADRKGLRGTRAQGLDRESRLAAERNSSISGTPLARISSTVPIR